MTTQSLGALLRAKLKEEELKKHNEGMKALIASAQNSSESRAIADVVDFFDKAMTLIEAGIRDPQKSSPTVLLGDAPKATPESLTVGNILGVTSWLADEELQIDRSENRFHPVWKWFDAWCYAHELEPYLELCWNADDKWFEIGVHPVSDRL